MSLKYTLVVLATTVVCLLASSAQAAITSAEQRATLRFLQEFTDEYKKVLRPLWTGSNYCAWSGVTCDANDDVHVDLSGRGLSGDLPEPKKKEASLVRVVSIDLSNNPGIDDLESDWKYLTNLRKIDLSYTSVKGYIPDQWRSMSSLEELHAHHTALCRNLPDWSAATMPNLRVVDLSYNNFHGSIRGDWASFRKLEKFDISGNNFCGCAPASWRNVPVLAAAAAQTPMGSATCAYNSCGNYKYCPKTPNRDAPTAIPTDVPTTIPTDVPTTIPTEAPTTIPSDGSTEAPDVPSGGANPPTLNFLREFTRKYKSTLEYLWTGENYCAWSGVTCDANGDVHVDLSGRGLTGELPEADEKDGALVRVVSIDLSNNAGISGRFKNSWKNLGNLRRINLSHTSLFGALPDAWNGMRIIEEVYITNTRACLGLPNWAMRTLRRVDLSNNNLKGALAYSWVNMVSLESANLAGNSFCACMPVNWIGRPALEAAVDTASNAATLRSSTCGISNYCTGASYQCY